MIINKDLYCFIELFFVPCQVDRRSL